MIQQMFLIWDVSLVILTWLRQSDGKEEAPGVFQKSIRNFWVVSTGVGWGAIQKEWTVCKCEKMWEEHQFWFLHLWVQRFAVHHTILFTGLLVICAFSQNILSNILSYILFHQIILFHTMSFQFYIIYVLVSCRNTGKIEKEVQETCTH